MTSTPSIRALHLSKDATLEPEEAQAREEAGRAALARLGDLESAPWPRREDIERLQAI